MHVLAWDTETELIRPGTQAPELACGSIKWGDAPARCVSARELLDTVQSALARRDALLVGHNVAYDLGVFCAARPECMPLVFDAVDSGRVTDTMIRAELSDIEQGWHRGRWVSEKQYEKRNYSLSDLHSRAGLGHLEKDRYRMRYGLKRWEAFETWEEGWKHYASEDAEATVRVFRSQRGGAPVSRDETAQIRSAWGTHLMSAWGMRTRAEMVEEFAVSVDRELAELKVGLCTAGLVRVDGSRDTKVATRLMKEAIAERFRDAADESRALDDVRVRLTPTGLAAWEQLRRHYAPMDVLARMPDKGFQLDEDACDESGHATLKAYARYTKLLAVQSKDLPLLYSGSRYPIHTRFGRAASGRRTSSAPNLQNLSGIPGVRECFWARDGWAYANADYDQLELRTLAQVCLALFGFSRLAEVLNSGRDPHTELACALAGISSDGVHKDDPRIELTRKLAKVANFGFPGGLGPKKMVSYAANKPYQIEFADTPAKALAEARKLRNTWLRTWSEVQRLFNHTNEICRGSGKLEQLYSGRVRGVTEHDYAAACNSWFQGLGADATMRAAWYIAKACYVEPGSPLYGCRPVNYIHDEFLVECPDSYAPEAAEELARLMKKGADEFLPNVPSKTEPLLMRWWSKKAKTVRGPDKRLRVWGEAA